jgi:hypothetical protein
MEMLEVRRIIVFGEHTPECMRDDCTREALYVLIVKTGLKKGTMYLVCIKCFEELKAKHEMIQTSMN